MERTCIFLESLPKIVSNLKILLLLKTAGTSNFESEIHNFSMLLTLLERIGMAIIVNHLYTAQQHSLKLLQKILIHQYHN